MKKNPLFKSLLIATIFSVAFIMNVQAQINDAYARIEPSGQNFSCSFVVELSDTTTTTDIEVSLSTSPNANDVVLQNFTFDASAPSGYIYSRDRLTVTLGVPALTEQRTYYANVRVNNAGNWTSYSFITN